MSLREDQHPVLDMIAQIAAGQNTEASAAFDALMADRANSAIERAKEHVAATMFDDYSATIGEDADDEDFDDDLVFLTQDEYDALSPEEQAEFEALPQVEGEEE